MKHLALILLAALSLAAGGKTAQIDSPVQAVTHFGSAIAVDDITNLVYVGAPRAYEDGKRAGSVYAYTTGDGTFVQRLAPQTARPKHQFGASLAIDKGVLIVGAPGKKASTYVFEGGAQVAVLRGGGERVDISGLVFVSLRKGKATVYRFQNSTASWIKTGKFKADFAAVSREESRNGNPLLFLASKDGDHSIYELLVDWKMVYGGKAAGIRSIDIDGPFAVVITDDKRLLVLEDRNPNSSFSDWQQRGVFIAAGEQYSDEFGSTVFLKDSVFFRSFKTAYVGDPGSALAGHINDGAVFAIRASRSPSVTSEILPPNLRRPPCSSPTFSGFRFGEEIDFNKGTLAIGAPLAVSDANCGVPNSAFGTVYLR